MRILVISDSHGDEFSVRYVLEQQRDAGVVIFLGDGYNDIEAVKEDFPAKKFVMVRGNCDFSCNYPISGVEHIGGKVIYCTHGFVENVKYTQSELIYRARQAGADIALYGHTHVPVTDYEDGLHIFNPGSIRDGSYGAVDITDAGIVCINMKIKFI